VVITAIRNHAGELLGFGKVTRDFTDKMLAARALQDEVVERQRAQVSLQQSENALRDLSVHLLRTQDEERRRIGRDLHDSLGQYLAVLKMKVDSLAAARSESDDALELAQCAHLAEESIKEVRTIAYLLYPPMLEEVGLKSAIPWYLDGFSARSGIRTAFEVSPDFLRLSRDAEVALFRVLQESLTNVHRHSGSGTADVRLSREGNNGVLEVRDHGRGIAPSIMQSCVVDRMSAFGIGLRGMRERLQQLGGRLEVVSAETGTTVRAIVPLTAELVPGAGQSHTTPRSSSSEQQGKPDAACALES
jgi:signal transduction histidine kinase